MIPLDDTDGIQRKADLSEPAHPGAEVDATPVTSAPVIFCNLVMLPWQETGILLV